LFATVAAGAPEIASVEALGPVVAHPSVTADFQTVAGGVYEITPAPQRGHARFGATAGAALRRDSSPVRHHTPLKNPP